MHARVLIPALILLVAAGAAPALAVDENVGIPAVSTGQYRVVVTGWQGEEKRHESEFLAIGGFRGAVSSQSSTNGVLQLRSMVAWDARDPLAQQPGVQPTLGAAEEIAILISQIASFGELKLYFYLPGCDHFNAQIFRRDFPAPVPLGTRPLPEPGPEYELATLGGIINTPDSGIVVPEPIPGKGNPPPLVIAPNGQMLQSRPAP